MAGKIPDKIYNASIKDAVYFDQYSVSLNKRAQSLLRNTQDEIVAAIAKNDPTAPTMTKYKAARLEKLNEEIGTILDSGYGNVNKIIDSQLKKMGGIQAKNVVDSFNGAVGANLFDITLTTDGVKGIVENTMIQGNTIGQWWEKQATDVKAKLSASMAAGTQAIQIGLVQGETVGDLISRIRGTKLTPGIMSVTKREATALVRTSVMQVANAVRQETYKKNSDVLDGVEIVATLDKRTTPICRGLDGLRWDLNGQPIGHDRMMPQGPPFHWQCRSTLAPITKSWKDLAGPKSTLSSEKIKALDNIPVGMRASMNGPMPANMTYNDWLLIQPKEVQLEILGPGRWKLWTENKLDMVDLIDNSGNPLTLKQLAANLGDIIAKKEVALENLLKQKALEAANVEAFAKEVELMKKAEKVEAALPKVIAEKGGITQIFGEAKQSAEAAKAIKEEAKLVKAIKDPEKLVTFTQGQKLPPGLYDPVEGAVQAAGDAEKTIYGKLKYEVNSELASPMKDVAGLKNSVGIIVVDEETGKIWVYSPKNQFGGYKNTYPKGTLELTKGVGPGIQEQAIREVFEETGLQAKPLFHLGDYEKTTSNTRYYIGVKTGGSPTMMGWEAEAVKLVPVNQLEGIMNVTVDKQIAQDFIKQYTQALKLGEGDFKKGFELLNLEKKAAVEYADLFSKYPSLASDASKILTAAPETSGITMAQQKALLQSNMEAVAKKNLEGWIVEQGTVAGKVVAEFKGPLYGPDLLDNYYQVLAKINKEKAAVSSVLDDAKLTTNALTAKKKLISEGVIGAETDPLIAQKAVQKEVTTMLNKLDDFLASVPKGGLEDAAYKELLGAPAYTEANSLTKINLIKLKASSLENEAKTYLDGIASLPNSDNKIWAMTHVKSQTPDWQQLSNFEKKNIVDGKLGREVLDSLNKMDKLAADYKAIYDANAAVFDKMKIQDQVAFMKDLIAKQPAIDTWESFLTAIKPGSAESSAIESLKNTGAYKAYTFQEKAIAIKEAAGRLNKEAEKYLAQQFKIPSSKVVLEELGKLSDWKVSSAFERQAIYDGKIGYDIEDSIQKFNVLSSSAEGKTAMNFAKVIYPNWDDLPIDNKLNWLKEATEAIKKEGFVPGTPGVANGKLWSDLTMSEKNSLLNLDDALGNAFQPHAEDLKHVSAFWNDLDTSLKSSYLGGWQKVGARIPSEFLGTSEKALLKQAGDIGKTGTVNGKLLTDLNPSQKGLLNIIDDNVKLNTGWVPSKQTEELWNSLDSSVKQTYITDWKNAGKIIPPELLDPTDFKIIDDIKVKMQLSPKVTVTRGKIDTIEDKIVEWSQTGEIPEMTEKEIATWNAMSVSTKQKYLDDWVAGFGEMMEEPPAQSEFEVLFKTKITSDKYKISTLTKFGEIPNGSINSMDDFYALGIDPKVIGDNVYSIGPKLSKEFRSILELEKENLGVPWNWGKYYMAKFVTQTVPSIDDMLVETGLGATKKAVGGNVVTLGKINYDLSVPAEAAKFKTNQSYLASEYTKNLAKGKGTSKGQQDAYNLLSENAKAKVNQKIGKLTGAKVELVQPIADKQTELNFDNMVQYKGRAGSNKGAYYHDVNNMAERYYIKIPANEEIAKNEMLASKLYQAAGVEVPDLKFITVDGKQSIASTVIDNVTENKTALIDGLIRTGVQDNFVVDAWLGNWDVVGLNFDNLLIKDGVRAVRIDVGGSLRFRAQGRAKGLDFNNTVGEMKTMRDARFNVQSASIFKNIKQSELEAGARKVLSIPDSDIRHLVNVYGPTNQIERQKLTETLLARKQYLKEMFPEIKIEEVVKPISTEARITEFEFKKLEKSARINGIQIPIDKEMIEDRRALIWVEKRADGSKAGMVNLKLRENALQQMDDLATDAIGSSVKAYSSQPIYDSTMEALRGIAMQSRSAEALRGKDIERAKATLNLFEKEVKKITASKKYTQMDIASMKLHYKPWIKVLEDVIKTGENNKFKWDLDSSFKNQFSSFRSLLAKAAEKNDIKFQKVEWLIHSKNLEKGFAQRTDSVLRKRNYYLETEVDGVNFKYWPNTNNIDFAMRGNLIIETQNASMPEMEKALKILNERFGINTARASDEQLEALYLRQVAYARNETRCYDLIDRVENLLTDEEKIEAYCKELNKIVGYDIKTSPNYNYRGAGDLYGVGKQNLMRPDLEGASWEKFKKDYSFYHSLQDDPASLAKSLLDNGAEYSSTVEKTRKGFAWSRTSPTEDMESGGANYCFLRIRDVSDSQNGWHWKGDIGARVDMNFWPGDFYGATSDEWAWEHSYVSRGTPLRNARITDPAKWQHSHSVKEAVAKQSLSIFDKNFDCWIIRNSDEYDEVIKIFQQHGFNEWPDGRKLKDVIRRKR